MAQRIDILRATRAAITTSFLAAHALNNVSSPLPWAALTCFVGVSTLSLAILWPRAWEVAVVPGKLILDRAGDSAGSQDAGELQRDLAVGMGHRHDDNVETVGLLAVLFQTASLLLIVETVLWIVAIASTA